jgi:hypothetical protein
MGRKATNEVGYKQIIKNLSVRINGENCKKKTISNDMLKDIYDIVMQYLKEQLIKGNFIWIKGFGTFYSTVLNYGNPRKYFKFFMDEELKNQLLLSIKRKGKKYGTKKKSRAS